MRLAAVGLGLVLAGQLPPRAHAGEEPPFQDLARKLVGKDQGVLVQAEDGSLLASVNAERPVHPASVTKIVTTLALLQRLGPAHRFETRLLAGGPLDAGTLHGDLLVEAAGDPVLVFENAFLILAELRPLGLRRVEGTLVVRGPLLFNWRPDPDGRRLADVFAGRDGRVAWPAVRAVRHDLASASPGDLAIAFENRPNGGAPASPRVLSVHRSPPLTHILKALNCYSNNVFHLLSDRIGGPGTVERIARERIDPERTSEIVIDDAAGLGKTNRLSPRAAVAALRALEEDLVRHQLALTDVLPVATVDPGTLRDRLDATVVGKTGTIGSLGASSLAGALRTRRYGRVVFAILNRGLPVPEAQRRQDAFVRALQRAGEALPWPYHRATAPTFAEARLAAGQ